MQKSYVSSLFLLLLSNPLLAESLRPSHPCLNSEAIRIYQTQTPGPCFDFTSARYTAAGLPFDLSGSKLYNKVIRWSLSGRRMIFADMAGAIIATPYATHSDFTYATLKGMNGSFTNWSGSHFSKADLRGAKLFRATFTDSVFSFADLSWTDLSFADFTAADLRGADLTKAYTLGTVFQRAVFDSQTLLPFSIEKALQKGMVQK